MGDVGLRDLIGDVHGIPVFDFMSGLNFVCNISHWRVPECFAWVLFRSEIGWLRRQSQSDVAEPGPLPLFHLRLKNSVVTGPMIWGLGGGFHQWARPTAQPIQSHAADESP